MVRPVLARLSAHKGKAAALSCLLAWTVAGGASALAQDDQAVVKDETLREQDRSADTLLPADQEQQAEADQAQDERQQGMFDEQQLLRPGTELSEATVGALHGSTVVNARGEEIGSVRDIVISRTDRTPYAVVDVGGWLGIGGTQIAVPLQELEIRSEDQVAYMTEANQEQIQQQAESYDQKQYISHGDEDMPLAVYMQQNGMQRPGQAAQERGPQQEGQAARGAGEGQAGGTEQSAAIQGN